MSVLRIPEHDPRDKREAFARRLCSIEKQDGAEMISRWSDWRRFPRAHRGDNIVAPICPGIYEIRVASSGALYRFGVTENIAQTLSGLSPKPRTSLHSFFFGSDRNAIPDLEYRTCATSTKAEARAAAAGMTGRRELFFRGAA